MQQAAIIAYNRTKFSTLKPYSGVKAMLSALSKKYRLAVLSDAPRNKAWQRLILTGLDAYFSQVGTFHDTGKSKPDNAPFLAMCKRLKVKPSECLFVGDNPARDVAGAKSVGMRTAWAAYGHVWGEKNRMHDFVIKSPRELLGVIRKLG
jgi:putative hydrolase of the HAD superfamily